MEAEQPHDILAAEAFAVGEGDQALHHEPPHDVLAAEEFAVPAAERHAVPPEFAAQAGRAAFSWPAGRWLALGALILLVRRRRRRD